MQAQSPPRNTLIKLIKTAQRALGLDDATYRDMLESITGLRSCADKKMTSKKLTAVLARMRELGFTPTQAQAWAKPTHREPLASPKQQGLVRGLWQRMYTFAIVRDTSDAALNTYCRRMVGKSLDACTRAQCQRLIECLKQWWRRVANPDHVAILENMLAGASGHVVQ